MTPYNKGSPENSLRLSRLHSQRAHSPKPHKSAKIRSKWKPLNHRPHLFSHSFFPYESQTRQLHHRHVFVSEGSESHWSRRRRRRENFFHNFHLFSIRSVLKATLLLLSTSLVTLTSALKNEFRKYFKGYLRQKLKKTFHWYSGAKPPLSSIITYLPYTRNQKNKDSWPWTFEADF